MKKYYSAIAIITAIYLILASAFLFITYQITDGSGWDFVAAIILSVLSLPVYSLVINIPHYIGTLNHLKGKPLTRNNKFEKAINTVAMLSSALSFFCLIPVFISMSTHIKNKPLRIFCNDIAPDLMFFLFFVSIIILLNRPITKLIVLTARRFNKSITIDSTGIFITRICLIILFLILSTALLFPLL